MPTAKPAIACNPVQDCAAPLTSRAAEPRAGATVAARRALNPNGIVERLRWLARWRPCVQQTHMILGNPDADGARWFVVAGPLPGKVHSRFQITPAEQNANVETQEMFAFSPPSWTPSAIAGATCTHHISTESQIIRKPCPVDAAIQHLSCCVE